MQSSNKITEENAMMVGAYPLFYNLRIQKEELARLKPSTMAHAWVQERGGKLELMPLDDDFGRIQARIAILQTCIETNEPLVVELNEAFREYPVQDMSERVYDIGQEIETIERALHAKIFPFMQAAEMVHADPEKVPEVIRARAATAIKIAALKQDLKAIEAKRAEISLILGRVAT